MFCPNCGRENPDGVAFCAGCGMAFGTHSAQPAPQPAAAPAPQPVAAPAPQPVAPPAPEPVVYSAPQPAPEPAAAPIIPQPQPQAQQSASQAQPQPQAQPKQPSDRISFGQHFKNLIKAATHPVTGPAEIAGQYDKIGNALFIAGIVIVICWLVGFFSSLTVDLVQLAKYGKYAFDSFGLRVVRDFFFPCIYYAVRVFGCAGIFMLAGLIIKEKWSFPRLLAISAMATAPAFIVSDMLGSIVGLIPYVGFGSLFTIAAYAYYLLMLYEGMGAETKLTGNKKGFVLVICVAITGFVAHYF